MGKRPLDAASAGERVFVGLETDFRFLCRRSAEDVAEHVESEIELMVLTALLMAGRITGMKSYIGDALPGPFEIQIVPQFQWESYRIDFCVRFYNVRDIFVECDGHEFHERTKEQAEHDRSKDRAIQAAGIPILRFTGREIWRDPGQIVNEIFSFVSKMDEGKQ